MESTKDIILACACDQYLTDGYKGLSMRKIADKANISATAIYRHFGSKDELFHFLVRKGFSTYTRYLIPALDEKTAQKRLNKTMEYALDFILEQPKYFELIFSKSETKDELANFDDLRAESKISFDFYTTRISECMKEGYLKQDNPGEVAVLLLSAYMGFFSLYGSGLLPRSKKDIKSLYWRTIEKILFGIAAK
jgi:AcrR family transcriptional regulator